MKKVFAVLLMAAALFLLAACETSDLYNKGYSAGYDKGTKDTLEYVSDAMYDILWDLEQNTSEKYGLHPDEAAVVLDDFMSGVPVSDEELQIAIDSICGYYYDSFEIPKDIEGLDLYID